MASGQCFVVTGPSKEARDRFEKKLTETFVFSDGELINFSSDSLTSRKDSEDSDKRYFLVMARSIRYNLWVENDKSSMIDEIQLMCGCRPEKSVEGGTSRI